MAGFYFRKLAHPCTHLLLGHGLVFDRRGSCWRRGRRCHGDGRNIECCAQHVLPLPPARCPPDTAHTATELKTLRGGPVQSGFAINANQGLKPSRAVECCSCEGTNIHRHPHTHTSQSFNADALLQSAYAQRAMRGGNLILQCAPQRAPAAPGTPLICLSYTLIHPDTSACVCCRPRLCTAATKGTC